MVIFRKHIAGLSEATLAKFVTRAGRALRLQGTVNVLVTSSRELRVLNHRFRDKDQPTDVLSFAPELSFGDALAGDIAISAEMAKKNARRLGHSAAQEIKILVLHGVLHLAGYDHERDHGLMAGKETKLRKALGLPVGLIERNGPVGKKNLNPDGLSPGTQRKASSSHAARLRSLGAGRRPVSAQTVPRAGTR